MRQRAELPPEIVAVMLAREFGVTPSQVLDEPVWAIEAAIAYMNARAELERQ